MTWRSQVTEGMHDSAIIAQDVSYCRCVGHNSLATPIYLDLPSVYSCFQFLGAMSLPAIGSFVPLSLSLPPIYFTTFACSTSLSHSTHPHRISLVYIRINEERPAYSYFVLLN